MHQNMHQRDTADCIKHLHSPSPYIRLMGGERASTTRQRESGRICCTCKSSLPPGPARERYCDRCAPRRRVYMHFMLARGGWYCQFLEEDLKTPLPRKLTFQEPEKVIDMAKRGGAVFDLAGRQAIEHGIGIGRGGVWLSLMPEQYGKLR